MITLANDHITSDTVSTTRARLLIVDDDRQISRLHAIVLRRAGYEVVTASDGATALEHFADSPFDLVLTDRQMPKLDGANMLLALRSAGSRIPVVMVSGSLAHKPLPPAVARELSAALVKPVHADEVLLAVEHALRKSPQRESLYGVFYAKSLRSIVSKLPSRRMEFPPSADPDR